MRCLPVLFSERLRTFKRGGRGGRQAFRSGSDLSVSQNQLLK